MAAYDIKKQLGNGGFGIVYLAYDKINDREVALKYINITNSSIFIRKNAIDKKVNLSNDDAK